MDDEAIVGQIDYIEEQVDFLIELCNSLKSEKAELKGRVEILEGQLQEKTQSEAAFVEQRENIRGKIDGLMDRLNNYIDVAP
ncbi:cell division protein ZapB [Desulfoluna sp.]|uniref:cell division protein ZapB n=1 Tax=Desulfoluna sp. TaxID=2045199 RepID=UPI00260DBA83|nr:cell division protein ZapB [Desulfoluna sp.]